MSGTGHHRRCCCAPGTCTADVCGGAGATPATVSLTFASVSGACGCHEIDAATSAQATYVLSGTFDLVCCDPGGSTVEACYELTVPGSYGNFYDAAGCTGNATPITSLYLRLRTFTTGGFGAVRRWILSVYIETAAGSSTGLNLFNVSYEFPPGSSTFADCVTTFSMPNFITACDIPCCDFGMPTANRNGTVTVDFA